MTSRNRSENHRARPNSQLPFSESVRTQILAHRSGVGVGETCTSDQERALQLAPLHLAGRGIKLPPPTSPPPHPLSPIRPPSHPRNQHAHRSACAVLSSPKYMMYVLLHHVDPLLSVGRWCLPYGLSAQLACEGPSLRRGNLKAAMFDRRRDSRQSRGRLLFMWRWVRVMERRDGLFWGLNPGPLAP